jgi:hypothetical protein
MPRLSNLLAFKGRTRRTTKPSSSSVELHHDFDHSVVLDVDNSAEALTIADFIKSLPSLDNARGAFVDSLKIVPKKFKGKIHTVLSTLQGAPKGKLRMSIAAT